MFLFGIIHVALFKTILIMKNYFLIPTLLLVSILSFAQVGINTTTPDDGSALQIDSTVGSLVPPRMTEAQMLAIPTPLDGSTVYNITAGGLFFFTQGEWVNFKRAASPTILLERSSSGNFILDENTFYQFPVSATHIVDNNPTTFTLLSEGKIRVLEDGVYNVTASFSSSDLPIGGRKYIIGVYKNNTLVSYPNRGFVDLPQDDFWGTSGTVNLKLNANNVIDVRYVLNKDATETNQTAPIRFVSLGITKLN